MHAVPAPWAPALCLVTVCMWNSGLFLQQKAVVSLKLLLSPPSPFGFPKMQPKKAALARGERALSSS